MTLAPVLALLLSLPSCYSEPRDTARLELIARAIADTASTIDDAAGLLTIGWHESNWCESVHSGRRRGGHGIGLWQIEPGSRRMPPFAGLSAADTQHAAGEALWLWRHSYSCGHSLEQRYAAYAGLPCGTRWAGARSRARMHAWVLRRLRVG